MDDQRTYEAGFADGMESARRLGDGSLIAGLVIGFILGLLVGRWLGSI